jgi:hypothetical protein
MPPAAKPAAEGEKAQPRRSAPRRKHPHSEGGARHCSRFIHDFHAGKGIPFHSAQFPLPPVDILIVSGALTLNYEWPADWIRSGHRGQVNESVGFDG